jgi:hypothetical protein
LIEGSRRQDRLRRISLGRLPQRLVPQVKNQNVWKNNSFEEIENKNENIRKPLCIKMCLSQVLNTK